jgi:hypothetical protein
MVRMFGVHPPHFVGWFEVMAIGVGDRHGHVYRVLDSLR